MKRTLDIVCAALLAAALVVASLAVWQPWEADVSEAVAIHAAEPLDCNDLIIRRWETPDGVEVLPPELTPLWQYVQEPDFSNAFNESDFRSAFERDLHNGDPTFHLTHEVIDGKEW